MGIVASQPEPLLRGTGKAGRIPWHPVTTGIQKRRKTRPSRTSAPT